MPQKVKARRAATEAANRCRPQAMSSWLEGVFESAGLSRSDSEAVAKNLTEAEERGIRSHGLILVPVYVERIRSGGIRGRYTMTVVREHGATLLLDGDGGPGQSLAFRATELAIAGARKLGSFYVGLRNGNHVGMLASYGLRAAEAGLACIVQTNSGPSLCAMRGRKRLLGNNALCFAAPCGTEPLVIDMATGMVACGKIRIAGLSGEMLPDPWILDAQGNPSRKPADLDAGGCVRPMGEHKGYALAVMIDILSALMAGGLPSLSVHNQRCAPEAPTGASQSFHAIDPERFAGRAFLEGAIDAYRNALREALPSDPRLPVLAPGDPEIELTRIARMEGIPVAGHIVEAMDAVADDLGQPIFSDSCEKCETWQ